LIFLSSALSKVPKLPDGHNVFLSSSSSDGLVQKLHYSFKMVLHQTAAFCIEKRTTHHFFTILKSQEALQIGH